MRAVIVTGRMVQDHEYLYPFYRLQEAGYEVDVAVPGAQPCVGIIGVKIEPTRDVIGVADGGYDVMIIPGGVKCMEHLRLHEMLVDEIARYHRRGGVIGVICSGAQLLISAGLCRGRNISGYYSIRVDIENAGGHFVDAPAVTFDRIVSAPHYKHLGPWMAAVLAAVEHERERARDA